MADGVNVEVIRNRTIEVVSGTRGPVGPLAQPYIHTQSIASATWVINHNLGRHPAGISLVDSSGRKFFGQVDFTNTNTVTVTLTAAQGGTAYIS